MSDFASLRMMMVDTQVRPSDVTKFPIIEAMLNIPREVYVPHDLRAAAYVGKNLTLPARGRVVLEARTAAKMLDALDLQPGDLVLDIGPGLGYSAALLARMVETVIAVEEDESLAADAERLLAEQGVDNAVLVRAGLTVGEPKHGPYDAIIVEGGIETFPEALAAQLKEGGRVAALFMEGNLGTVRIGHKIEGRIDWRFAFNASAPVLPGFALSREFSL